MSVSLSSLVFSLYNPKQSNSSINISTSTRPSSKCWIRASSSSAAPGIDFTTLQSAIAKKDSNAVKEALDQLSELGWAKKWSSQPYVSRRTVSP